MLSTRNLSIRYSQENEITFPDIDVSQKDAFLIHGPSGCGKTTLGRSILQLIKPTYFGWTYKTINGYC